MKLPIGLAAAALLATGFVTATPKPASAVIYCTYVGYPAGCIARAGVVLRPRPVARAAAREAVRPGTPRIVVVPSTAWAGAEGASSRLP